MIRVTAANAASELPRIAALRNACHCIVIGNETIANDAEIRTDLFRAVVLVATADLLDGVAKYDDVRVAVESGAAAVFMTSNFEVSTSLTTAQADIAAIEVAFQAAQVASAPTGGTP